MLRLRRVQVTPSAQASLHSAVFPPGMSERIAIRTVQNGVEVLVDDVEVFDLVDDLLTENEMEYEYFLEEVIGGKRYQVMHFGSDTSEERLRAVIDSISKADIERIWKLNN